MDNHTLTLQQLFEGKVFKVPNYQRGYSWESKQRKDLIEDLESINNKKHYTSTIVLKYVCQEKKLGKTYEKYDIVDGQQRITSLIIFLSEIKKKLHTITSPEAEEIAKNIEEIYLKHKSVQGGTAKLVLDENNNFFFEKTILELEPCERKIESHEKIQKASDQFRKYLELKEIENQSNFLEYLKKLIDKITTMLVFTI